MRLITRKCVYGTTQLGDIRLAGFARNSPVPIGRQKIGVLVIDDHAGMREGITAMVNAQTDMTVVGQAGNGEEAIQQFKDLRPDVSLLDWNLPVVQGEEVLRTLNADIPKPRVIVMSALNAETCIRRALSLGAQSYLHKDMLRRELLPAIRAVHEGQQYMPEEIARLLESGN
jgi:two-component system, NarL family, response regulator